jgi:hypothetical protein
MVDGMAMLAILSLLAVRKVLKQGNPKLLL